jgi:hypothetical protein
VQHRIGLCSRPARHGTRLSGLVHDVPAQEPGDSLQADMRMRRDAHARHAVSVQRAVVVDEAPRANAPAQSQRQEAADGHVAHASVSGRGYLKVMVPGHVDVRHLYVCFDGAHFDSLRAPRLALRGGGRLRVATAGSAISATMH